MKINIKYAVCLAWIAIMGSGANLNGAAYLNGSGSHASPPKLEKIQIPQPDFGFTTSERTKKAFDALKTENDALWRRDIQSTMLYRSMRTEINELRNLLAETKKTLTEEKRQEVEKKEVEITKIKKKNDDLEKIMKEHAYLKGKNEQLQKNYDRLIASLESGTNRTARSNANFASFLAAKNEQGLAARSEQRKDQLNEQLDNFSDDEA